MAELLPTFQAEDLRQGLSDYLTTTFALTDSEARGAIQQFLSDPESGLFKGPYVRLRLPFKPAADGWRESLDWHLNEFEPYGHQAAAFQRLSSKRACESGSTALHRGVLRLYRRQRRSEPPAPTPAADDGHYRHRFR